jgi:hypothetical protein
MESNNNSNTTYGKRPLWQWIALYVVVGGAVYAAIYYFYGHKSANGYSTHIQNTTSAPAVMNSPPAAAPTPAQPRRQSGSYNW